MATRTNTKHKPIIAPKDKQLIIEIRPGMQLTSGIEAYIESHRIQTPNWQYWEVDQVIKIWEAVALSLNIDPVISATKKYRSTGASDYDIRLRKIKNKIVDRPEAGKLQRRKGLRGESEGAQNWAVLLADFVECAIYQNWTIPDELKSKFDDYKNSPNKNIDLTEASDIEIHPRVETSLLLIIAAIAKESNLDISMNSKAAEILLKNIQIMGKTLSKRTIETYLKKASEL